MGISSIVAQEEKRHGEASAHFEDAKQTAILTGFYTLLSPPPPLFGRHVKYLPLPLKVAFPGSFPFSGGSVPISGDRPRFRHVFQFSSGGQTDCA